MHEHYGKEELGNMSCTKKFLADITRDVAKCGKWSRNVRKMHLNLLKKKNEGEGNDSQKCCTTSASIGKITMDYMSTGTEGQKVELRDNNEREVSSCMDIRSDSVINCTKGLKPLTYL